MKYSYICPLHREIEEDHAADSVVCGRHITDDVYCNYTAKRNWRTFATNVVGDTGRWDPVVGQYVANNREFMDAVKRGKEEQEAKLGMEVTWTGVDARDHEGLAELHFQTPEQRDHDLEGTRRNEHDRANA